MLPAPNAANLPSNLSELSHVLPGHLLAANCLMGKVTRLIIIALGTFLVCTPIVGCGIWLQYERNRSRPRQCWSGSCIKESQRRGDLIIDHIRLFKSQYGRWPADLQELTAHFDLRRIPPTAGTCRWEYGTYVWRDRSGNVQTHFSLRFGTNELFHSTLYPLSYASSQENFRWIVDE